MKKIIQYAALGLLLVVLPLGSFYYLKKGFNFQLENLQMLEPKGDVPAFSFLSNEGDTINSKLVSGSPHVVHFFSDDEATLKLLHQISQQFKDKDVHLISYLPHVDFDFKNILKKYDIEIDKKKSNWHFVPIKNEAELSQLLSMYRLSPSDESKILIIGKDLKIRGYYDENDDQFGDTFVSHVALMLPKDKKKEIRFERQKEK